jgi:hypothetical protein
MTECKPALYLGTTPGDDNDAPWLSTALNVDMRFIDYTAKRQWWSPLTPPESSNDMALVGDLVDAWMRRDFHVLSFRSVMGTGKSTMIAKLIRALEHFITTSGKKTLSVLILTHRQSLAIELSSDNKLAMLAFANYLVVKDKRALWDRDKFPNLICQVTAYIPVDLSNHGTDVTP